MKRLLSIVAAGAVFAAGPAWAAEAWTKRMYDTGNTNNVGVDPKLSAATAPDLSAVTHLQTNGIVNATPIVSDGLLFIGDGGPDGRFFYVFDLATTRRLVVLDTRATGNTPLVGSGVQSTANVATITVPVLDGDGIPTGETREERRVYIGVNRTGKTLWCLSVDAILAQRDTLLETPAEGQAMPSLTCAGANWPIAIQGEGSPIGVYNSHPVVRNDVEIVVGGERQVRDVLYTPTMGADCSDGQMWAMDPYTTELFWAFDSVPNHQGVTEDGYIVGIGFGGVVWTSFAFDAAGEHLYITTGDCVEQPQVGFMAESLVALDPATGVKKWHHQRRLIDVTDYDIGNGPTVVDGGEGCEVIVSTDKDGCIYGFRQDADIPEVGDLAFDPSRPGQQRVLWRSCFLPGSLTGGFNASGASANGRTIFAQANATAGLVPGDDAYGFAVDACTGKVEWAASSIRAGQGEGAIASDMWFQPSQGTLEVFSAGPTREHLASVELPSTATAGGGGPSIVDGTIYVPVQDGVVLVRVVDGSAGSAPQPVGTNTFRGPYPVPIGTGVEAIVLPSNVYDPNSAPAGPVSTWPSMNPSVER